MKIRNFRRIIAILALMILAESAMVVHGDSKREVMTDPSYLLSSEEACRQDVKDTLSSHGRTNSGVTLTRATDAQGVSRYTVVISHRRLGKMTDAEMRSLKKDLYREVKTGENCIVSYDFLL